jgi:lipopolysaccharide export system permease protein
MSGLLDRAAGYRLADGVSGAMPGVSGRRSLLDRAVAIRAERYTPAGRSRQAAETRRRFTDFYESPLAQHRTMSGTLFRYIVVETFISFFVAFLFFFGIFFINQLLLVAREILSKKVPVIQVVLLVLYSLPSIVAMAAPFAAMVGTLMSIGKLSSDNEILVMLSSGLPYRNIVLPAVVVGLLVSLASFVANDILLPLGTLEFSKLYRRIFFSTPALELESNSVKRFRDTIIITGVVSGNVMNDVLILDKTGDGERRIILAKKAALVDGGRTGLSLDLNDAFIQSTKEVARRDYDYASAGFLRYFVPQEDIIQAISSVSPREMSSRDVWREIRKKETVLSEQLEKQRDSILTDVMRLENALRRGPEARSSWRGRTAYAENLVKNLEIERIYRRDRSLSIWRLEFYKKFSIPFGAFSFIFLSVSLGLLAKKSGQTVGFLVGSIIAVLYWAMLLGGQTLGISRGFSPFFSMWLPNILALSIGSIMLIIRVRR